MKDLHFDNYEDLALAVADKYDSLTDEYPDVSIIAKYDEAKEIIKELFCLGYDIASIDIHRENFEGYYDEYAVSLTSDGVWCEKFKRDNGYLKEDSDVTYISNECNSAVIPHIKSKFVYFFDVVSDDDDKNCDDEYMPKDDSDISSDDKDNKKDSKSTYTIKIEADLDDTKVKEKIDKMEKEMSTFNDRIDKVFRSNILRYCEIMDEMNDFAKLLW